MPVDMSIANPDIRDFLIYKYVAVLATANETGEPQASTVYFSLRDGDMDFFFVTKADTEKNLNLTGNPRAALVIFDAETQETLQVKGTVNAEKDVTIRTQVFNSVWRAAGETSKSPTPPFSRLEAGDYIIYRLHPNAIRLTGFIDVNDQSAN